MFVFHITADRAFSADAVRRPGAADCSIEGIAAGHALCAGNIRILAAGRGYVESVGASSGTRCAFGVVSVNAQCIDVKPILTGTLRVGLSEPACTKHSSFSPSKKKTHFSWIRSMSHFLKKKTPEDAGQRPQTDCHSNLGQERVRWSLEASKRHGWPPPCRGRRQR